MPDKEDTRALKILLALSLAGWVLTTGIMGYQSLDGLDRINSALSSIQFVGDCSTSINARVDGVPPIPGISYENHTLKANEDGTVSLIERTE